MGKNDKNQEPTISICTPVQLTENENILK